MKNIIRLFIIIAGFCITSESAHAVFYSLPADHNVISGYGIRRSTFLVYDTYGYINHPAATAIMDCWSLSFSGKFQPKTGLLNNSSFFNFNILTSFNVGKEKKGNLAFATYLNSFSTGITAIDDAGNLNPAFNSKLNSTTWTINGSYSFFWIGKDQTITHTLSIGLNGNLFTSSLHYGSTKYNMNPDYSFDLGVLFLEERNNRFLYLVSASVINLDIHNALTKEFELLGNLYLNRIGIFGLNANINFHPMSSWGLLLGYSTGELILKGDLMLYANFGWENFTTKQFILGGGIVWKLTKTFCPNLNVKNLFEQSNIAVNFRNTVSEWEMGLTLTCAFVDLSR